LKKNDRAQREVVDVHPAGELLLDVGEARP
jgi:hypothetical protein